MAAKSLEYEALSVSVEVCGEAKTRGFALHNSLAARFDGRRMQMLRHMFGWWLVWLLAGAAFAGDRVVSQTVGSDELLLAVADPGQVAALSHIADDPAFSAVAAEARAYARLRQGDAETILRHRPTLVLFADYSRAELVEQVRRAGVEVMVFDRYASFGEALANLRRLGARLGPAAAERAERLAADGENRLAVLRERLEGVRPARVIAPSIYGVMAGSGTTFHDLCAAAAADNLGHSLGGLIGHAQPPSERVLTWPVERVVLSGDDVASALAPFKKLPPYQFMPAVREGRAVVLAPWMLGCVSHRRIEAYEALARALHPERFATP